MSTYSGALGVTLGVMTLTLYGCSGELHSIKKLMNEMNPPPQEYGNCQCFYYDESEDINPTECHDTGSEAQCDSACGLDEHSYGGRQCEM